MTIPQYVNTFNYHYSSLLKIHYCQYSIFNLIISISLIFPYTQQDLSASADFDPLNATNLTPSQRSPAKANDDDILTGQQSSTRLIKTRSTKIKTEKP
jgi:hypothetical protein